MISLQEYKAYFEDIMARVTAIKSVNVVTADEDMGERLKVIKAAELPALFIVTPTAKEDRTDPDNARETNSCLIFLLDRADAQRKTAIMVLESTQPIMEKIKEKMRYDAGEGCGLMRNLDKMTTTPETGIFTEYCGWSLAFNLITP